jgi:hypothetical protein
MALPGVRPPSVLPTMPQPVRLSIATTMMIRIDTFISCLLSVSLYGNPKPRWQDCRAQSLQQSDG